MKFFRVDIRNGHSSHHSQPAAVFKVTLMREDGDKMPIRWCHTATEQGQLGNYIPSGSDTEIDWDKSAKSRKSVDVYINLLSARTQIWHKNLNSSTYSETAAAGWWLTCKIEWVSDNQSLDQNYLETSCLPPGDLCNCLRAIESDGHNSAVFNLMWLYEIAIIFKFGRFLITFAVGW